MRAGMGKLFGNIQGYSKRIRLQRRLYRIDADFLDTVLVPCSWKLVYFGAKSFKMTNFSANTKINLLIVIFQRFFSRHLSLILSG